MSVHAVPLNPGGRRGSGAFTLVELLIVIAIIAILVTIIMPTVRSALGMARQATCSTNHRAICQALQAYHGDNDTFPYNYGDYAPHKNGQDERWALGYLARYVGGSTTAPTCLRLLDEGEFPSAYVCPAADLDQVYGDNATDKYHACYWTNICIRANRGWGKLFNNQGRTDPEGNPRPPGWDGDSGWAARITGWKICSRCHNWRSVYNPTMQSVPVPEQTVFTGDTNNNPSTVGHDSYGNEFAYYGGHAYRSGHWVVWPGADWLHGSLGFDRHDGKLLLGYVDGSVRPTTLRYLEENYSRFGTTDAPTELTGDFLIAFPETNVCSQAPPPTDNTSRIHFLPEPVVE